MAEKYAIDPDKALMLGIDWQVAFGDAIPVPHAHEAAMNGLLALEHWRPVGKVVLTRHVYRHPSEVGRLSDFIPPVYDVLRNDSPQAELYPGFQQDGDILIDKTRFNALHGTQLDELLDENGIDTVIVHGLTTPICVQTTVDGLMMGDRKVVLLDDACASQAMGNASPEEAHYNAVQRMKSLFAEVIPTAEFLNRIS
jgi:nicotinamidase-related amidase